MVLKYTNRKFKKIHVLKKEFFFSKNIIKLYRRKIKITSKLNFCFSLIFLIEVLNYWDSKYILDIF
jgi:hypothetical protein